MVTTSAPLFVSSGDLIADRRYKWAIDHARRGDLAGAADILAQTVEMAPAFATAWFALGAIRDTLGDRAGAVAAFTAARDADPDDYHGARLHLARLAACSTSTHPTSTSPCGRGWSTAGRSCCSRQCGRRPGRVFVLAPCWISVAA